MGLVGKPHQGVEDAPCRRSDLLHEGHRQPVPAVSACRRVLAAVEPALADAQTLAVARGAVRHLAPPPDQDRRARGRAEDDDPASPADGLPRPSHPAGRSRADAASGHMTDGGDTPPIQNQPHQPANLTDPTPRPESNPTPTTPKPPLTTPPAQTRPRPSHASHQLPADKLGHLRRPSGAPV